MKKYPVGTTFQSHHDQTFRFNMPYEVLGYFPRTIKGMKEIMNLTGKASVSFSVFK